MSISTWPELLFVFGFKFCFSIKKAERSSQYKMTRTFLKRSKRTSASLGKVQLYYSNFPILGLSKSMYKAEGQSEGSCHRAPSNSQVFVHSFVLPCDIFYWISYRIRNLSSCVICIYIWAYSCFVLQLKDSIVAVPHELEISVKGKYCSWWPSCVPHSIFIIPVKHHDS